MADNLAVIESALDAADEPLGVDTIHGWRRRLMRHSRLPSDMIGRFRPAQGWVGGTSPVDAAYVPPPPSEIPRLVDDLLAFADGGGSELDAVSRAAVAHAQFEAIHPYGDGNGRIGRALIGRVLRRCRVTARSTAPVSVAIARDPGGYLSGLRLFEQGKHDPWVRWFAETAARSADVTESLVARANLLMEHWRERASELRTDHTARALLELLPARPVISARDVSELLGVTERSGRTALGALVTRRVLTPMTRVRTTRVGRSRHWFAATELLDLWVP